MESTLDQLFLTLADQNFITYLLANGTLPYSLPGISFEALPSFYPTPFARRTFRVQTSLDTHYLLKFNQDGNKIHREVAICNWLRKNENHFFYVPAIISWDAEDEHTNPAHVHWLLGEWVASRSTVGSLKSFPEHPEQIISGLVWLNKLRLKMLDVQAIFRMHLPQADILLEFMNRRRNVAFEAFFEICDSKTKNVFQSLQQAVASYPFTKRIGLVHGDFHLNNVLLSFDPVKPKFTWIDWEDATMDHPLSDLAHLLVFEEFSPPSLAFMELFLQTYNRDNRKENQLSKKEVWLLAAVWLTRMVGWNLRMQTGDKRSIIEKQAVQSAQFIFDQMKD